MHGFRLVELLGALSLATDLASGVPIETSLRTAVLAARLGDALGLPTTTRTHGYQATLLRHLGCTAWSHEAARLGGDDHDVLRSFEGSEPNHRVATMARALRVGRGAGAGPRVRAVAKLLGHPSAGAQLVRAQCDQAQALAADLGLDPPVIAALGQIYERHDGAGGPQRLAGDAIEPAARVLHAAQVIEIAHRQRGRDAVADELRRRRGGHLAPAVADAAIAALPSLWPVLEVGSAWDDFLAAEPARVQVPADRLPAIALAFARYADLKSPHAVGHSPAVAALAAAAAALGGLPAETRETLRLAALVHDLGAVAVGSGIWDTRGPLSDGAWEQVRLHAYWTERILARTAETAPLAALAGHHHERPDGGGYPRGVRGDGLSRAARILAAADAWCALTAARPHRPAFAADAAAAALTLDARAGRFCPDAVALVTVAAGQPAPPRAPLPAGLSAREAEVLALLARGLATKEIAVALAIAPRTVKAHIEHIYDKTGVSSRAAAALFAARHELA